MLGQHLVGQAVLELVALKRAGEWNDGGVHAAGAATCGAGHFRRRFAAVRALGVFPV